MDASAVAAWLLPNQATDASERFQDRLDDYDLEAPFIFGWEVHNLLLRTLKPTVENSLSYDQALEELFGFDIVTASPRSAFELTSKARDWKLSLFDAAYLAQALEQNVALISRDRALVGAAQISGVKVHDLT